MREGIKKSEIKLPTRFAIDFGISKILDGMVTLLTLGNYTSDFGLDSACKIAKWRVAQKEQDKK